MVEVHSLQESVPKLIKMMSEVIQHQNEQRDLLEELVTSSRTSPVEPTVEMLVARDSNPGVTSLTTMALGKQRT